MSLGAIPLKLTVLWLWVGLLMSGLVLTSWERPCSVEVYFCIRQKNWVRRFLGPLLFFLLFPSFICRTLDFSGLMSWTNREVSVLNSAFTDMPNVLIVLNA